MSLDSNTRIKILSCMHAHFKQSNGDIRPGRDWIVSISDASGEHRIVVRSYDDYMASKKGEPLEIVASYVADLLNLGWTPDQFQGLPAELEVGRRPSALS